MNDKTKNLEKHRKLSLDEALDLEAVLKSANITVDTFTAIYAFEVIKHWEQKGNDISRADIKKIREKILSDSDYKFKPVKEK